MIVEKMSLKELHAECDRLNIKKYGRKAAIIERIKKFKDEQHNESNSEMQLRLEKSFYSSSTTLDTIQQLENALIAPNSSPGKQQI